MKKIHTLFYLAFVLTLGMFTACQDDKPGDELAAPAIETDGANDVARTSCTVSGIFRGNLSSISAYGVKYSTSSNFPLDATQTVEFMGNPHGTVTASLSGLSPNTHYYYCWYATTGNTLVQSYYGEFTTTSTSKPQFSEITVDSIGENYALLRCRVEEIGDQYLVEGGISYRIKSNVNSNYTQVAAENIDSNHEFTVSINELTAATTYEIRPYAKNSSDINGESGMLEGYGETITLTTENKLSPELETYEATDISMNSARVSGKVISAEGSYGIIDECGFCYSSTTQSPTINDKCLVVSGVNVGDVFEATLTNLEQVTTYYVRPYAKNTVEWQERVGYGTVIEFTTSYITEPQVSFTNTDNVTVTPTTITLQAQINNFNVNALSERGFIWSTDDRNVSLESAKAAGNCLTVTTTDKAYTGIIENLMPSTNYYIRAYAIYKVSNDTRTGLSSAVSIATDDLEGGTMKDVTLISRTTSSLTVSTGISDLGTGSLSEVGFCWRKGRTNVYLENCDNSIAVSASDNSSYSTTISDLEQGTYYTVRGYVKTLFNSQEIIAYSDTVNCITDDFIYATLDRVTILAKTPTTLTVESGVSNLGNGELVEKGFCWNLGTQYTPTLENCDGSAVSTSESSSTFSYVITGLSEYTGYAVRSYVKTVYENKTLISYSSSYYAWTVRLSSTTLDPPSVTVSGETGFTVTSRVSLGSGELTEKGFCWKIGSDPTLEDCDGFTSINDGTTGSFTAEITNLHLSTLYYIRAYAKTNVDGIEIISYSSYSNSKKTGDIGLKVSTSTRTDSSVTLLITCDSDYENQFSGWSIALTNEGNTTLTPKEDDYIKCEKDESGVYQVTLKDLKNDTSYKATVRAKHQDGYYINETISFSTAKSPTKDDMQKPTIKQ